jgi:hypothetical protein
MMHTKKLQWNSYCVGAVQQREWVGLASLSSALNNEEIGAKCREAVGGIRGVDAAAPGRRTAIPARGGHRCRIPQNNKITQHHATKVKTT